MKNLLSIVLIAGLSAGLTACKHKKEEKSAAAASTPVVAPAAPVVAPAAPVVAPVVAPETSTPSKPEVKKVCVEINGVKKCKNAKVHKKFEGTQVPPKK